MSNRSVPSTVKASIRPDNVGSRATIAGFGFGKIGEQWNLEDVYLRDGRDPQAPAVTS